MSRPVVKRVGNEIPLCSLMADTLFTEVVYWREASAGQSRSACFIGRVASTLFRLSFLALHFTTFFAILATPIMHFPRCMQLTCYISTVSRMVLLKAR